METVSLLYTAFIQISIVFTIVDKNTIFRRSGIGGDTRRKAMDFIKKIISNSIEHPDYPILCDDTVPKGISYSQLGAMSGKVYAYLKDLGIGKEDFVLLCLPRSIQPLVAMVGVLRAGAAFVIVEDNYAPERIEFIKKDCGCKTVIDSAAWEKIQLLDPLDGCEEADEHDAAFAVYTSGTTGNPKGVLHEYGNLDRMIESIPMEPGNCLATTEDRFALVAPLNFVASMLITVVGLYHVITNYVVAYSVIKNPLSIGMFIIKNRITGTFLTPSYIRRMKSKPPQLRFCIIGSEPANEVYLEGLTIHNFYLMSESGFAVTHFLIDKKYEQTPVGHSEFGHEILLLDESGNPVPVGEEGEVCFENKYVRGYMNLPEQTAAVFKDGIYHTGDLARRLPDGDLVICGRLNDMVKINGNRVEPGEIEGVAKKVLGVDWTAARIFDDGNQVYICVYYLKNLKIDFEQTRNEMAKYLPYYMLPSYFIHIDQIPLRPNGKMDRKALPAPDVKNYQAEYVAPTNETEEALCASFEKVLKLKRVGINDDFYQLGGDSLASMDVLVSSGIKGLTTADIFAGHTPQKIAELYHKKHPDGVTETDEERDDRARTQPHPLNPFQAFMIDYQMYTPMSTMWNLGSLYRFELGQFDVDKLAQAISTTIKAHPALCSVFSFNEDGEMIQTYKPELAFVPTIEEISEIEFSELKNGLVSPFKVMDARLFRVKLFKTEKYGYLFFDVHHTIFDGTSFKVLMGDIAKAYLGEELEPDYYYLMLQQREEAEGSPFYLESKDYFERTYGGDDWVSQPKVDHETHSNASGDLTRTIDIPQASLKAVEKAFKVSRNEFFITAFGLAFALHQRARNVKFSWIYNGREDVEAMSTCGLLFRDLPVGFRLTDDMDIRDIYASASEQVAKAIEHSCYPYVDKTLNVVSEDVPYLLYQSDIHDAGADGMAFEQVDVRQNNAASQTVLDAEILDGREGLKLALHYAASRFDPPTVESFADILVKVCGVLAAHTEQAPLTFADIRDRTVGRPSFLARLLGRDA